MRAIWGVVLVLGVSCKGKPKAEEVAETVKQATVFVRTAKAAGSSFVVRDDGDEQYLLSNAHVVSDVPVGGQVELTYYPGSGREWTGKGTVVTLDTYRDLAVLRTTPPAKRPLPLKGSTELKELMPVIISGFPFGDRLSLDEKAAAVSLSRASISALRTSVLGEIDLVQLDNNLNPGNSGGPVVNEQGAVVGISVAALRGSGISFVIPWAHASALLEGRAFEPSIAVPSSCDDGCEARISLSILDPFARTRRVELRVIAADDRFLHAARTDAPTAEGELAATASRPASGVLSVLATVPIRPHQRYFLQLGFEGDSMVYGRPFELLATREAPPAAKPRPAEPPRPVEPPSAAEAVAPGERACWRITQVQEVGTRLNGDLQLTRRGDIAEGTAQFEGHPLASVAAAFRGSSARLLLTFPNGIVGAYEASYDERSRSFVDGLTGGSNGASARWSAVPVACP